MSGKRIQRALLKRPTHFDCLLLFFSLVSQTIAIPVGGDLSKIEPHSASKAEKPARPLSAARIIKQAGKPTSYEHRVDPTWETQASYHQWGYPEYMLPSAPEKAAVRNPDKEKKKKGAVSFNHQDKAYNHRTGEFDWVPADGRHDDLVPKEKAPETEQQRKQQRLKWEQYQASNDLAHQRFQSERAEIKERLREVVRIKARKEKTKYKGPTEEQVDHQYARDQKSKADVEKEDEANWRWRSNIRYGGSSGT